MSRQSNPSRNEQSKRSTDKHFALAAAQTVSRNTSDVKAELERREAIRYRNQMPGVNGFRPKKRKNITAETSAIQGLKLFVKIAMHVGAVITQGKTRYRVVSRKIHKVENRGYYQQLEII